MTSLRRPSLKLGTVSIIFRKASSRGFVGFQGGAGALLDEASGFPFPFSEPAALQILRRAGTVLEKNLPQGIQQVRGLSLGGQPARGDGVELLSCLQHAQLSQPGVGAGSGRREVEALPLLPGEGGDQLPGLLQSGGIIEDSFPEGHLGDRQGGMPRVTPSDLQKVLDSDLGEEGGEVESKVLHGGPVFPESTPYELAERQALYVQEGAIADNEHGGNVQRVLEVIGEGCVLLK